MAKKKDSKANPHLRREVVNKTSKDCPDAVGNRRWKLIKK